MEEGAGGSGGLALLVPDDGVDQKRDLESDQRKSNPQSGESIPYPDGCTRLPNEAVHKV